MHAGRKCVDGKVLSEIIFVTRRVRHKPCVLFLLAYSLQPGVTGTPGSLLLATMRILPVGYKYVLRSSTYLQMYVRTPPN